MERGQAGKRPARADCEPSLHGRGQMERKKSPVPVVFVRPFGSRATPQSANAASSPWKQGEPRVLTKSRKNEALIRNDGVYVISGIFCRANACVCGKNAFRPDRWPQIVRFASGRADSMANQRFVNDQSSPWKQGGAFLDSATSQEVALSEPPFGIKGRWHGVSRDGGIDKGDARLARL